MNIEQTRIDTSTVELILSGRLDAASAPILERKIKQWGNDITELILDFTELAYISSLGLRVLLKAKKLFSNEKRKLTIKNMNESVREVFEMTGFLKLMVQEEQFILIRKDEPGVVVLSFNGQMQSDNIAALSKGLSDIKEADLFKKGPVTVVFDMANLTYISSHVCKLIKKTVDETAWENRIIKIKNASLDILPDLEDGGLGEWVAGNED